MRLSHCDGHDGNRGSQPANSSSAESAIAALSSFDASGSSVQLAGARLAGTHRDTFCFPLAGRVPCDWVVR
jgi:hypothetical protein